MALMTGTLSTAERSVKCSKCGENEATEKHPWCNPCKTKYQREYMAMRAEHAERRAFLRGAAAMREKIIAVFSQANPAAPTMMFEVMRCLGLIEPPEFQRED